MSATWTVSGASVRLGAREEVPSFSGSFQLQTKTSNGKKK
jgi:hypothetical protein